MTASLRPARWPLQALLLAALAAPVALHAQAKPEPLRPEVAKALQAAQEAIRAGRADEALARVREAAAVPQPNPQEAYLVLRLRAPAAALAGDEATATRDFEAALASGRVPAAERPGLWLAMAQSALRGGDGTAALRATQGHQADGGQDPRAPLLQAQAQLLLKDGPGVVRTLQALVAADEAAGRTPAEPPLKLLAASQLQLGDEAGYRQTLERLVRHHPTPAYWADLIARLRAQPDLPPTAQLDALRLARRAGALEDRLEVLELVQLAVQAGLPAEALAVLDEAAARGTLGNAAATQDALRQRPGLLKAAADDRAQWPAGERSARQARDGAPLIALGLAQATAGATEPGLALMEAGLAKGVSRQPALARLRWAVALRDAGRREAAQTELQALAQGRDALAALARYWTWMR